MPRFRKLSHVIRFCQYFIVCVPMERNQPVTGLVGHEVKRHIAAFLERLGRQIAELSGQGDHISILGS